MKSGRFITIEGGEGAGKTTLIQELERRIMAAGIAVVTTREPGGIAIAEQIRGVILDSRHTSMDGRTEALLYAAARRQHLVEKVIPALKQGFVVICDRFIDSSLAYQGYARGLGMEAVWEINRFAIGDTMPDLTIWMDIEPEEGLKRIHKDDCRELNRLDLEGLKFHEKVRSGYEQIYRQYPNRIVRIDASAEPDAVARQAIAAVEHGLKGFFAENVKL
ncbi:dTMP kinase [Paenibacillus sp. GCM10012307]|uniref:Thymidylate kinase n=1 Tax=Paenibacillus roseus TaxID=2798579 RepID=A0A934J0Z6_9BACL|nr:dTMP kinase [Paenibacillus roseus]MBJ6361304.1 dTMP kinase [Paenibacillus roseus]